MRIKANGANNCERKNGGKKGKRCGSPSSQSPCSFSFTVLVRLFFAPGIGSRQCNYDLRQGSAPFVIQSLASGIICRMV